jgi:Sec7-like guanine-nucleotide exchange factor
MEAFAGHFFEQLTGPNKPFASADAAFILSFSTIMLNTDLHNPQIPVNKKMTKDEFIRNNRGINDGQDIPREYLSSLYDEIKAKQIQVDIDVSDPNAATNIDVTDPMVWNKLINKQQQSQAPARFTPSAQNRKHYSRSQNFLDDNKSINMTLFEATPGKDKKGIEDAINKSGLLISASKQNALLLSTYEADMFLAMTVPIFQTMNTLWTQPLDDLWVNKMLQGSLALLTASSKLGLVDIFRRYVVINNI